MTPEVSIQSLLDRIKTEGIEEAKRASEDILKDARAEAAAILAEAKEEAREVRDQAHAEIQKDRETFESAMSQAGRNLMIGLKRRIVQLCSDILEKEVRAALDPEVMKEMILKMVDRWRSHDGDEGVEVLLNEPDLQELDGRLIGSLQAELRAGVVLKPAEGVQAGFRIGEKGGSMHYDLTDDGLTEILSSYLSPRIARFLDEASREDEDG